MPQRFCAICGKNIDRNAPHFGMCGRCYSKENLLFYLPKRFSFKYCLDCGSYSKKEEWILPKENNMPSIIEEAIFRFLLNSYLKENKIEFTTILDDKILTNSIYSYVKSVPIIIRGISKENNDIKHEQTVELNLNYVLCKNCSNLRTGNYYISIIQLRVRSNNQFNLIDKVLETIHRYVEKLFKKDAKQYISKVADQKYGVDLFLSSNELMNHIITYLRDKYHFILKRSKKLVGRDVQRGKNIYRLKALIKFLPIIKDQVIFFGNKNYSVENIIKNKVILQEKNGEKLIKDFSFFFSEKVKIKKDRED
jgi:nonsense-mediated mRNA decay protein 3